MAIKDNLIRLMEEKKLTISELASLTDISIPSLKRLRTQKCNPTLDVLIKLSQALNTTIGELIKDTSSIPTFQQDETIVLPESHDEFMFIFTRDTFSFKAGTKALFKKYSGKEKLTKYILYQNRIIMSRVNDQEDELIFRDEVQNLHSVHQKDISGFIIKQLYEVTYV
jgi:transcriptional regulator with XRE-family HTH domain